MRSMMLLGITMLISVTAFVVYERFSATHNTSADHLEPQPPPPVIDKSHNFTTIDEGQFPWFESFDQNTGALKEKFRATKYTPLANGQIQVTNPVSEFYMPNNQLMRVTGETGEVVVSKETMNAKPGARMGGSPPRRGQLHHVTIEMFNLFPNPTDKADEVIHTDNIQFDNDRYLITTESYTDADGKVIAADQVPVHMTSRDSHTGYDFDGRGLTLRWNNIDGRLDLLIVAHGEVLVIKDTSSASGVIGGSPAPKAPAKPSARIESLPSNVLLASYSPGSIRQPAPPAKQPAKAPPIPVPYQAIFYDNVRVTQGDEVVIIGDRMDVDFVSRQQKTPDAGPGTAPLTMPSGGSGTAAKQSAAPTIQPIAPSGGAATGSAAAATSQPTTQPDSHNEPVYIHWTGQLVMKPNQPDRPKVAPGDAIVELTGRPVSVRRVPKGQTTGDDIRAARLVYHTADGHVRLDRATPGDPVIMSKVVNGKIDPATTVTTDVLNYAADANGNKYALLSGDGHARMPVQSEEARSAPTTRPAEVMDVVWHRQAKLFFLGKGQEQMAIEHIDLAGDVDVKHPQLAMQSQSLSLYFAPPNKAAALGPVAASQPAQNGPQQELRRVLAFGDVHAVMTGQNGKKQTLTSDDLDLRTARTPDGKFYAKKVFASGRVHALDADQELWAESMDATLRPVVAAKSSPTTKQSNDQPVELESLVALHDVRVKNKDGSKASGEELHVTTDQGQSHIRLIGAPTATVVDAKNNVITGPIVLVEPKQGIAHVAGAGTMHLLQEGAAGSKAKPVDITWTDQADMNGPRNLVLVTGNVRAVTPGDDGAVNTAEGNRMRIDLVKKPTTQPASGPTLASAKPDHSAGDDAIRMEGMGDKQAQRITLDGNARVISTTTSEQGVVVRQFALFAPKVIYQMLDSKDLPARTVWAPAPGKMFVGDHRPTKAPTTKKADEEESDSRGDTAFQWNEQMIYREASRNAVLKGDVVVVHRPEAKDGQGDPIHITSDRMTAWFEPKSAAVTRPTTVETQPAATRPGEASTIQLKHVIADGNVDIIRAGARMLGDRIDYVPATHVVVAHGSEDRPVRYEDPDPKLSRTAVEMEWNTLTWNVKASQAKSLNPR